MTPKEKAFELLNTYRKHQPPIIYANVDASYEMASNCAIVCVDEIISSIYNYANYEMTPENVNKEVKYWQEVKQEIEKL